MTPFWAVVGVVGTILGSLLLNVLSNECSDLSPWLAGRLVRWAARRQYRGSERAAVRAEEWASLIEERPGKLLKLVTALWFAAGALLRPGPRARTERRPLLPRLGRASARAGLALAVTFLAVGAEFSLVFAISFPAERPPTMEIALYYGLTGGVFAALETLARGLRRLRPGMVSGLAAATLIILISFDLGAPPAEAITAMLLMVVVGMLSVYLAARVRGRKGWAVYVATVTISMGTLSAFIAAPPSPEGIIVAGVGGALLGVLVGLAVGLGVMVASRALDARPTTAPTGTP